RHRRYLLQMGLTDRVAGERPLEMSVAETASGEQTLRRMVDVGRQLRDEDGAEAVIMGCAGMARHRRRLEDALGIPVIDPTQAAARAPYGIGPATVRPLWTPPAASRSVRRTPPPSRTQELLQRRRRRENPASNGAARSGLRRQNDPGLAGNAPIMLDASVALEVEDCLLAENCGVEVAVGHDQFVILGLGLGDDLAIGIDDDAAGDHGKAVLRAALCHRDDPG